MLKTLLRNTQISNKAKKFINTVYYIFVVKVKLKFILLAEIKRQRGTKNFLLSAFQTMLDALRKNETNPEKNTVLNRFYPQMKRLFAEFILSVEKSQLEMKSMRGITKVFIYLLFNSGKDFQQRKSYK